MSLLPQHHPDTDLLVEFASGTLDHALAIAVSAHLHYCPRCRNEVKNMESIAGSLLMTSEQNQAILSDINPSFNQLMANIEAHESEHLDTGSLSEDGLSRDSLSKDSLPKDNADDHSLNIPSLPRAVDRILPQNQLRWRKMTSALHVASLVAGQDQYAVSLQKLCAGGYLPEHQHRGKEATVVLRGSFSDESSIYNEGDFVFQQEGDIHRPIAASNDDCICLTIEEAPVKITGMMGKLINPFLRIKAQ